MTTSPETVRRFDAVTADLAKAERLPNGWLLVDGKISRVGRQEYENPDGSTHWELRIPEEVFEPESMRSMEMLPFVTPHPSVLLDAANTHEYQRGFNGTVRKLDDEWLASPIKITDLTTVEMATTGRRVELSAGYTCVLDDTQDPDLIKRWGPYKFLQRRIRGNHIALVDEARAGSGARIRLDGRDAVMATIAGVARPSVDTNDAPRDTMAGQIVVAGIRFDATDANMPAIQAAMDREVERLTKAHTDEKSTLTQRLDAATTLANNRKANGAFLLGLLHNARITWDAVKASMIGCDECDGSGQVPDGDGNKKCDMCDGEGSIRMHMPIKQKVAEGKGAKGKTEDSDGDNDADDLDDILGPTSEMDEDELDVEKETEQESGAAYNKNRTDAARRRRNRRAEVEQYQEDHRASIQRRIDRGVRARASLEAEARPHLDADFAFAKSTDAEIRKAVILKLNPNAKLDGKTDAQINERFAAELERVGTQHADAAVQSVIPTRPQKAEPHADGAPGHLHGRELMMWRARNPSKPATAAK